MRSIATVGALSKEAPVTRRHDQVITGLCKQTTAKSMDTYSSKSQKGQEGGDGNTPMETFYESSKLPESMYFRSLKLGYGYLCKHLRSLLLLSTFVVIANVEKQPHIWEILQQRSALVKLCFASLMLGLTAYLAFKRKRPVYLLDFSCYRAPFFQRIPFASFMEYSRLSGNFEPKSLEFQQMMLERSGLSELTTLPLAVCFLPARSSLAEAREEFQAVAFGALDELFTKTGVKPRDVGILIVNCSLFAPMPSLCAMIINRYKMRSDIESYNLSGMGCSAGVISIDLAKDLLQVRPNTYAIVFSTENITENWYFGNCRPMLVPNCLFRVGGAAMLLSNKPWEKWSAKYQLLHVVRMHRAAEDKAFRCVFQEEDDKGKVGVNLSRDLMIIAGEALQANITALGPLVLPFSEKLAFLCNVINRKFFNKTAEKYTPDFKLAFDHFCIHAGGRAVIDVLEEKLALTPEHVEASRMTLYRFGNTSSSSTWYELAYLAAKWQLKKEDRVWQIAFGSGFKCNSIVWKVLRDIKEEKDNPWANCIADYPVEVLKVRKFT